MSTKKGEGGEESKRVRLFVFKKICIHDGYINDENGFQLEVLDL